jgi:hypothetical protein
MLTASPASPATSAAIENGHEVAPVGARDPTPESGAGTEAPAAPTGAVAAF